MKEEIIALSPAALFGLFAAGALLGNLAAGGGDGLPRLITAAALMFYGWQDGREGWKNGTWTRGWLRWTYQGPSK